MSFIAVIRTMDKRLRAVLAATALLVVPGIGQFVAIHDLNTAGRESDLAFLFMMSSLFIVPTSLIVSAAAVFTVRRQWRQHRPLVFLAGLNVLICLNLVWFLVHSCSWAQVFGLSLRLCHQ